ncbi:hypothetical protein BDP27DRAFT_1329719 [Rhodocollybia butyracea]|uniref:Uncharacterized protein n=1 Tax=Rhodocollybia butyracea TaxID=206335 RepID=A0A9P5PP71_9AGAR|nr:hypothetical protein BDP27DRAFT_1329719 [Rhodocollybia butyracea]
MRIISGSHYDLASNQANEEWSALIPPAGHTVHVASSAQKNETHTVTLLHQLKCLDIIRLEYITPITTSSTERGSVSGLTRHCMNYLRQTILCRPNLRLESTREEAISIRNYDTVCRDWTKIYREVERNQADHMSYVDAARPQKDIPRL